MKRRVLIPLTIALLLLVVKVPSLGQERSQIRVKNSEIVTGVVVIDIVRNGRTYELQCNAGGYLCQPLINGYYTLVELPENFGMYVCRNVEIYSTNSLDPDKTERLGEYCLIEK
jgi:hypothetical protein